MSLRMQGELLRVVQKGEVRPLGAKGSRRVDVRVLCASYRSLKQLVERGSFRADLYYRLAVVRLRVPPLRERIEDVPALLEHFMREFAGGRKNYSREVIDILWRHDWPGNVRELRNRIERAVLLCEGEELTGNDS